MCYSSEPQTRSSTKRLVIVFFSAVVALSVAGSFVSDDEEDVNTTANKEDGLVMKVLRAFSLRRNWTALFRTSTAKDEITCLHGMRALNALALLIFHKSSAVMFNPYVNRTAMAHSLGLAWSVIGRTAIIYTDSFILLSGLLTSHGLLRELDRTGSVNLKERYWNRLVRIVPSLFAVIMFCTFILVDLGSGPLWGLVVEHHSELCRSNMWRNFLFIHNYFGFENMVCATWWNKCLTHTHQLGIDMQLFLVSPFLVWFLWRHRALGVALFVSIALMSTFLRYTVALHNQLSPVLYFGATVSQMFATANLSYILPSHRATVYLMGMGLGYFLSRVKSVTLNRLQATLAYVMAISLGLYAMCGPYELARRGYQYSASDAAIWNAGAPIIWSIFLGTGVILCAYGYGGKLNEFLSWRGFVVFTRIAYAVYLTQFPIFFYSVGSQRTPEYYTPFMLVNFTELAVILIISIAFTLLFDLPFQELKKISWREMSKKVSVTNRSQDVLKNMAESQSTLETDESMAKMLVKRRQDAIKLPRSAASG